MTLMDQTMPAHFQENFQHQWKQYFYAKQKTKQFPYSFYFPMCKVLFSVINSYRSVPYKKTNYRSVN